MRGVVVHDESGGGFDGQPARNGDGQRRFGQGDVREATQHREGHDAVARAEPRPRGRGADTTGNLDPRHEREWWLHLILATGEQEIREAHARGGDVDDDTSCVLRLVDLDQTEAGWTLEALNLLRAHPLSSVPLVAADDAIVGSALSGAWGTLVPRGG